jgi:hypothetical protein
MQSVNFGRIEQLKLRAGDPVLEPTPRVVLEIKIGGENGPRPERARADFLLKDQVVELLNHLRDLGDAEIEVIEVKHGLPFRMLVAQVTA